MFNPWWDYLDLDDWQHEGRDIFWNTPERCQDHESPTPKLTKRSRQSPTPREAASKPLRS